ncbi:MAG: hypothetical protein DMG24_05865 [Acidobacteria bacterium]|nr:MAG: hypothetical protein DMG24_05865 [Acidobacteriota bacterium]
MIGVDETQEFKIQTNAFTAQYGLSMGNIVNAISKSGTGQLHGDVFGFLRNDELDANNFFNNRAGIRRPEFIQTQWGGTVGGPFSIPRIYEQREKTFFFASYQRRRAALPATLVTTLPTTAFTGGDFSALLGPQIGTDALGRPVFQGQIYNPFTTRQITAGQVDAATGLTATESGFVRDPFVGNIILPTMFDPVAVKATAFYPAPTSPGLVNNFTASAGEPAGEDAWTGRIDHNVSDKTRVWGRYSQKDEFLTLGAAFLGAGNPAGPLNGVPDNRLQVGTGFSHTFDPSLVMNFNVGWLRWVEERKPQGAGFKPSALGLAPILDSCCANFPAFAPGGFFGLGAASNGGGARVIVPRRTISIASDFTKVRGRHSIQWGWQFINFGEIDHFGSQAFFNFPINFTQGPNPLAANPVTGSGFASFLLGTGSGSVSLNADTIGTKDYWGWYIQDDWKATPKLTLNLGVRYDIQMAPTDRHDRFSSFDFSGPNPISAAVGFSVPGELVFTHDLGRRGAFEIQKTNFAPRVGLAYQTSNKLVFRSGFAMFYVPAFQLNPPLQGFTQSTPFVGTVDGITPTSTLKNAFTGGLIQPPRFSLGGLTNVGLSVAAPEPRLPTPYVEQWTGGFQYQLANNDRLSVTYVGNHGVRLSFASLEKDQLPDSALALGNALLDAVPNPFFGHISASSCGLDQPTVPRGQLLRPYPEYCSVTDVQPPASFSNYHSVVVEWNHRWSEGVQFLASYTISKYLDNSTGPNGWANWSSQQVRDNYNLSAEKALDEDDIPNSFVFSWIYQLPVGRGKHFGENLGGALNQIVGGWQVSGVATFKDGFPLSIWAVNNNTTSFGGFQRPNRVGKATISNPAVEQAFNTAAFAQPPAFTFGNVARAEPNLRAPGLNNFDIGIGKYFNWREKLRFEYRAEFFNAFNRVNFYAPAQAFGAPGFGQLFSAFPGRDIQMALKIYF